MILVEEKPEPGPNQSLDAAGGSSSPSSPLPPPSERSPLLPPSPPEIQAPPPSYASVVTPQVHEKRPRHIGRWLLWALALYFAAGLLAEGWSQRSGGKEEQEEVPPPQRTKLPEHPSTPSVPSLPPVVDFPGAPWNSSMYLPPVAHGTPSMCNSRLSRLSNSSLHTSVLRLPISDLDLFIRFATVRVRGKSGDPSPSTRPSHPEARVEVVPWLESDSDYADWSDENVLVVVQQPLEEDRPPLEVCRMETRSAIGVGLYSSSDHPPSAVEVFLLVPVSPSSERTVSSFLIDGISGNLTVGDLVRGDNSKRWDSLEIQMKKGLVSIEGIATKSLAIRAEDADVQLTSALVTETLHVHTTQRGSFVGNLTLFEGVHSVIDTTSGSIHANISLLSFSADDPPILLPPHLAPKAASDESLVQRKPWPVTSHPPGPHDEVDEEDTFPLPTPLTPGVISLTSGSDGNVTMFFPHHAAHIPLQATVVAKGGLARILLNRSYQGSLSLISVSRFARSHFPPDSAYRDPFGHNRPFRIIITHLTDHYLRGSLGFGWRAKPDWANGFLKVEAEGTAEVGTWGFGL